MVNKYIKSLNLVPITVLLILVNITFFCIGLEKFEILYGYPMTHPNFKFWQPITSMFLHGSNSHVLSNCLYLFLFGIMLENRLGSVKFFYLYIIAGIMAWLSTTIFSPFSVIGASGAVFGIVGGYLVAFGNSNIRLFLMPIEFKAKYLILFIIGMEILNILGGLNFGIAHWAHIGGFVTGYIIYKYFSEMNIKNIFKNILILEQNKL